VKSKSKHGRYMAGSVTSKTTRDSGIEQKKKNGEETPSWVLRIPHMWDGTTSVKDRSSKESALGIHSRVAGE
jgi:hypothetical protein